MTFNYNSDILTEEKVKRGRQIVNKKNVEETSMVKKDRTNGITGSAADRKLPWIKGTKYLLDTMFFCGILVTASLPWSIRWIGELLPGLIRHYEETVIIYFVLGVSAEKLLWELRKIFRTVLAEDCFVKENVVSLQKMGNWSFFIALMAGVRSIVYMTVAMLVVILVFVIAGLFSKVLSFVFEQAVEYKEETDWTI